MKTSLLHNRRDRVNDRTSSTKRPRLRTGAAYLNVEVQSEEFLNQCINKSDTRTFSHSFFVAFSINIVKMKLAIIASAIVGASAFAPNSVSTILS